MQNRYVGDLGDFAKYALLRSIADKSGFKLGVVWCLFENELHNCDGRHTSYLQRGEFRNLDPVLHDRLALIVRSGRRSVRTISRVKIFPSDTVLFDSPIAPSNRMRVDGAAREAYRTRWISQALAATLTCELIFFDPDNGLEIPSVPKHGPKAGKYIFLDELNSFWQRGQSLIIYHHLNRSASVQDQTCAVKNRILTKFADAEIVNSLLFRRGSCRHFWIIGQATHSAELRSGVETMLASGWSRYFEAG
jgi:hypothetical protein